MPPRIFTLRSYTRCAHAFCRSFASQEPVVTKITLNLCPKTSKESVLSKIDGHMKRLYLGNRTTANHHVAILASQDFTTWLEDQDFIGSLLWSLCKPLLSREAASQIDILAGVADGIPPKYPLAESRGGLSILHTSTSNLLPDLWDPSSFSPHTEQDKAASISFLSSPLARDTRQLEIVLPLANTVFQNGRRSTLFASRWRREPGGHSLTHDMTRHKQTQRVIPRDSSVNHTLPFLPLMPLTPPRKIVAGLGNILRQIELKHSPRPASQELEELIPRVLKHRREDHSPYGPNSSEPVGVWAWIIPPHVIEKEKLLDLKTFRDAKREPDAESVIKAMTVLPRLMSSGCRLYKILSGGGGWGSKQGLLSLDPETRYVQPEQDDLEMFINAFEERNDSNSSEGLVTPGSYVLFCVEPRLSRRSMRDRIPVTTYLGVTPTTDEGVVWRDGKQRPKLLQNHFGASSMAGLFLRTIPEANASSVAEGLKRAPQPFYTKIDVPRSCLSIGHA